MCGLHGAGDAEASAAARGLPGRGGLRRRSQRDRARLRVRADLRDLRRVPGDRDRPRSPPRHLPHPRRSRRVPLHGAHLRGVRPARGRSGRKGPPDGSSGRAAVREEGRAPPPGTRGASEDQGPGWTGGSRRDDPRRAEGPDPRSDGRGARRWSGAARAEVGRRRRRAQAGRPRAAAERAAARVALPQGGDDPGPPARARAEDQRQPQADRRGEGRSAGVHHRLLRVPHHLQRAVPGPGRRVRGDGREGEMSALFVAALIAQATSNPTPNASSSPGAAPTGLSPEQLARIQAALQQQKLDGWLFYDFRGSDPIAYRVLGLDPRGIRSRRWYCFVPARGQPQKLVHAIEPHALDGVPGQAATYASWRVRDRELGRILRGSRRVAMQYSPRNEIPTVSRVDAGAVELVRAMGPEVVSSAELVAQIGSVLTSEELASQSIAAELLAQAQEATAQDAARRLRAGQPASERELGEFARQRMAEQGLAEAGAIVAVDAHSADPHSEAQDGIAGRNSLLLLDFTGRVGTGPHAIQGDLTRVYFLGERVPDEIQRVAAVVFQARDAALDLLRQRWPSGRPVTGADVDHAAREVIERAGFGEQILHRTGHSIDVRVHGDGVNNDDFETRDARRHLAGTCSSVEPGIYLANRFGIRSEVDVCLLEGGKVEVRGGEPQRSVPARLAPPQ